MAVGERKLTKGGAEGLMCGCECVPAPLNGFGYLTIPSGGSYRIMWCCDAFWWIFDWLWWVIVGSDRVYIWSLVHSRSFVLNLLVLRYTMVDYGEISKGNYGFRFFIEF